MLCCSVKYDMIVGLVLKNEKIGLDSLIKDKCFSYQMLFSQISTATSEKQGGLPACILTRL